MDPDHLVFLAQRRQADRDAMETAWEAAEGAWQSIEALNERIAKGVVYVGEHPGETKAAKHLASLKRQRDHLALDHEVALFEFRRMEEVYLLSARECRLCGVPEEEPHAT